MYNMNLRFDVTYKVLNGSLYPFAEMNSLENFQLNNRGGKTLNSEKDKGVYRLNPYRNLNEKTAFYSNYLQREMIAYCNEMIEEFGAETDKDILAYVRNFILNQHLKELLIHTGKLLKQYQLKLSDFTAPSDDIDMEKSSQSYILHLMRLVLIKTYLEMQKLLGAAGDNNIDERYINSAWIGAINLDTRIAMIPNAANSNYAHEKKKENSDKQHEKKQEDSKMGEMTREQPAPDEKKSEPAKPLDETKFFNPREIANMLKIDERSVRRMINKKEIIGTKIGHRWRISDVELNSYIEKQKKIV